MAKRQSLQRALKRGNLAVYWNETLRQPEFVYKKGSPDKSSRFKYAQQRMALDQERFQRNQDKMLEELILQANKEEISQPE